MKILLLYIFLNFVQFISSSDIVNKFNVAVGDDDECPLVERPVFTEVYFGWPMSISCTHMVFELEGLDSLDYEVINTQRSSSERETQVTTGSDVGTNATCVIWDLNENQVILNETADFPRVFSDLSFNILNFNETNSRNYLMKAWFTGKETSCIRMLLYLNVSALPQLTCEESVNISPLTPRKVSLDKSLIFLCDSAHTNNVPIHKHIISNYTVTWFKNCEHLPEEPVITGEWNDQLHLNQITFEHPGIYTCEVNHNGMRRYVNHYKMCVLSGKSSARETIHCTKKVYHSQVGENLVVECEGNYEHFKHGFHYHVKWKKISSSKHGINCTNSIINMKAKAWNTNATCYFHEDDVCFHWIPTRKEIENAGKMVLMRLTINNLKESDFGEYEIVVASSSVRFARAQFTIEKTLIPVLTDQALVIGISAAAVICWIICSILIIRHKFIYLRWRWRRTFAPVVSDDKLYGAFFSYHFSTNMDKFAQEQARDAYLTVRDELVKLGYTIYDQSKDGIYIGMGPGNALQYMKQSHRVVILLTSEFLKDHWDLFILQKGFEDMINNDSKLIFIMVPGMNEYIKQHSAKDKTIRMVQSAIKSNYSIEWSNDKNFNLNKFSRLLELAMPKLRSRLNSLRRISTSSSLESPHTVLYKKPFRRTMSNETGTTELGSPVSTDGNSAEFEIEPEKHPSL